MVRLWSPDIRVEKELSRSALGAVAGDIAIILSGEPLDITIISLGCQIAKAAKRKIHLLYVIEVPRVLPLKAVLAQESERADTLLNSALALAGRRGCEAIAEVVQAREAGPAIVDETHDRRCALLFIGLIRSKNDLGKIVPYVLTNAHCRVWLVQEPPKPSRKEKRQES